MIKGKLSITQMFRRPGAIIVCAAAQNGTLQWVYHENGEYLREDGSVIIRSSLDPHLRFRIQGKVTLVAQGQKVTAFEAGKPVESAVVDTFLNLPVMDANELHRFWLSGGRLLRGGGVAPEHIGEVLADQSFFWVGPKFGFGFYRAGRLVIGFVFDCAGRALNDSVKLPPMRGQLIDSTCFFSKDLCWFLWSEQEAGKRINHCAVIGAQGTMMAHESAPEGADDEKAWLATLRSKCAAGMFLLSATEDGLVRIGVEQGTIRVIEKFPDTEPFISPGHHLFAGKEGLFVVQGQKITLMKLNRS